MESYRDLNQSLQELFLFNRGDAPNIFENLVGVVKLTVIEESDAAKKAVRIHALFCHKIRWDSLRPTALSPSLRAGAGS